MVVAVVEDVGGIHDVGIANVLVVVLVVVVVVFGKWIHFVNDLVAMVAPLEQLVAAVL